MRDYKNVKVPKKYRSPQTRTSVKRADTTRSKRRRNVSAAGLMKPLLNLAGLAVLAGCCWMAWHGYRFLTHSEAFIVSGVDVKGVRRLSDADLKAIIGPFTGQNIFRADLETAARRARANPWIKEVRIHRALPNRISLDVVERVPEIVLEANGSSYLMDDAAVVIERIRGEETADKTFPRIVIRNYRVRFGESVSADGIDDALALLAEIRARGGWEPGDVTIKADSPEALSILYADLEFKIGSGMHDEKLRRLVEIMNDVKNRGLEIAYVDLRPANQAAVMVRNGKKSR